MTTQQVPAQAVATTIPVVLTEKELNVAISALLERPAKEVYQLLKKLERAAKDEVERRLAAKKDQEGASPDEPPGDTISPDDKKTNSGSKKSRRDEIRDKAAHASGR